MIAWASVIASVAAAIAYAGPDFSSLLLGLAELGGVTALFALVCAAEAYS